MRRRAREGWWAILGLAALMACDRPPVPPVATVTDSAGVRMIGNPPIDNLGPVWRVDRRPAFRIGWRDGEPTFESIVNGRFTSRGTVVVADQTGSTVWEISLGGEVLHEWGGEGDGPGELRGVVAVLPVGDSTFVQSSNRVSVFGPDGFSRSLIVSGFGGHLFAATDAGDLLFRPGSWRPVVDPAQRWVRHAVFQVPRGGGAPDTVFTFLMHRSWPGQMVYDPFEPFGWVGLSADQIVYGRSDLPEVQWNGMDGSLKQVARWSPTRVEVTGDTWNAWSASYQGLSSPEIDPARTEGLIRDLRPGASETLPLFERIFSDPDGNVWLAEYTVGWDQPRRYHVLGSDGAWRGYVQVPKGFNLLDVAADAVLGVEKDKWDVQAVSVYHIGK